MKSSLNIVFACCAFFVISGCGNDTAIDREALVRRHTVHISSFDPEGALSVGNGDFAFTVGVTGLQCFDSLYREVGIPTQTLSSWCWHAFPNTENYRRENVMKTYDFHGRQVPFAALEKSPEGQYFRINPHPAALGQISFMYNGRALKPEDISGIDQTLDMWTGVVSSRYLLDGNTVEVFTVAHPEQSLVGVRVRSKLLSDGKLVVRFHFPYAYQASVKNNPPFIWDNPEAHTTMVEENTANTARLLRTADTTIYRVHLAWSGTAKLNEAAQHDFRLATIDDTLDFTCTFAPAKSVAAYRSPAFDDIRAASAQGWEHYWTGGGVVDLSQSTDVRAHELERRIVLSQYVLKVNYSGSFPPSECGLVTPTWYGKHNSEVYFIHAAHFYQFGHVELLEKGLSWYRSILPLAQADAAAKGWEGTRFPKMAGIDGQPTPGGINPFIIWNFPNPIYLCELVYRAKPTQETLEQYKDIVLESGKFLASYAHLDETANRYVLGPPLKASSEGSAESETWNPTFELALWYYGLQTAQQWRVRLGMGADPHWDDVLQRLSKPTVVDGKYVEIETEPHIYQRQGGVPSSMIYALGYVPPTSLIDTAIMRATFHEINHRSRDGLKRWASWALGQAANTAVRLGDYDAAVEIITNDSERVRFLPQGYVRRPAEPMGCPAYMPFNGSFLNAIGLMAGGWDGAPKGVAAPGFPKNSGWVVRTEGLYPMP